MEQRIAIPTEKTPGAASVEDMHVSQHFGHCDQFTILTLKDGAIADSHHVATPDHSQGGCMVPVRLLIDEKANAVIVAGIGGRPLQGFQHFGVPVFHAGNLSTIADVVAAFGQNKLPMIDPSQVCGGGHEH